MSTSNVKALWAELEKNPKEQSLKEMLADALKETGDPADKAMAVTIQWCLKHLRWPLLRMPNSTAHRQHGWGWAPGHMGDRLKWDRKAHEHKTLGPTQGNQLPVWITDRMGGGGRLRTTSYKSAQEALKVLCTAFVAFRDELPDWS